MTQGNASTAPRRKLTARQRLFVFEYLVDLNATKAAERAGYSKKTARSIGQENLTKPDILDEIAEQQGRRFERLGISADAVLGEIARIAFANMLDYISISPTGEVRVDLARLTRDQAAAISEVTVEEFMERSGQGPDALERIRRTKFKLGDKLGALVDLGKHLKLFTDKNDRQPLGVNVSIRQSFANISIRDLSDDQLREFLEILEERELDQLPENRAE